MFKKIMFAYAIAFTAYSMESNSAITACGSSSTACCPPENTEVFICDNTGRNCLALVQTPKEVVRGYFTKGNCDWKPSSRHPEQFSTFLYLHKLKCKDDFSTCLVVGGAMSASGITTTAYVTVTHDGGQNWDSLETGLECSFTDQGGSRQTASFRDVDTDSTGKNWIAVGQCLYPDTGNYNGYVQLSKNGHHWRNAKTQPIYPGSRALGKINCNKESGVCIADGVDNEGRFVSTDAGENWFFIGRN